MAKAYYYNTINDFLSTSTEAIQGKILINDEFRATTEQRNAWMDEIEIMKNQLSLLQEDGSIIFEYTVPRIGSRIDVTIILHGIIFVLEFKVNAIDYLSEDEEQVVDYALDLKYFHEESEKRYIVPILVATEAPVYGNNITIFDDLILDTFLANKTNLAGIIAAVLRRVKFNDKQMHGLIQDIDLPRL